MSKTVVKGLNSRILADYLAQVGLAAVLSTQADSKLTFGWEGTYLWLDTDIDIVEFLLRDYQPSPILSPWNRGSGFHAHNKASKQSLDRILAVNAARLEPYQFSARAAQAVSDECERRAWAKERFAQELRNVLPDQALDWMDAAVVLRGAGKAEFPPLLGSGGNDGNLEFSVNFRDQLFGALPELGAPVTRSKGWLGDLVGGLAGHKLSRGPFGMYDGMRAGSPNSSRADTTAATTNPWLFLLMVEGLARFASGVSRRQGRWQGKASMPFTVYSAQGEDSSERPVGGARGEFWAPKMQSTTWDSFSRTIQQARATWDGNRAVAVPQMYAALRSYGVDRGIESFERFIFNQANGLAYVAVLADVVKVEKDQGIDLARVPLHRLEILRRAAGAAAGQQVRRLTSRTTEFTRRPTPNHLLAMLTQLTTAEALCRRSNDNRTGINPPRELITGKEAVAYLNDLLERSPELRIAAGLASARVGAPAGPSEGADQDRRMTRTVSMRDLLLGRNEAAPVVAGIIERPLPDILADVAVWTTHHAPSPDDAVGRILAVWHGYRTPEADVHRWLVEPETIDADLLKRAFLALLSIDWRESAGGGSYQPITAFSPELALLAPLAHGRVWAAGSTAAAPLRRGLAPSWASRLRAGQVSGVVAEVGALLKRSYTPSREGEPPRALAIPAFAPVMTDGTLLLAAMLAAPISISRFELKENR